MARGRVGRAHPEKDQGVEVGRGRGQGCQVWRHPSFRRYAPLASYIMLDALRAHFTGFGLSGIPETLLKALAKRTDVQDLIAVSNNAGAGDLGLGEPLRVLTRGAIH